MPEPQRRAGELDLHALHRAQPERFPFLLESRLHSPRTGRYSLLLGDVSEHLQCDDAADLPAFLRHIESQHKSVKPILDIPFLGGWFVYLAYEAAAGLLPHLDASPMDGSEPLARAARCRSAVLVDHQQQCSWLVGDVLQRPLETSAVTPDGLLPGARSFAPEPPERFCNQVSRAIEYILAGDIYQANLSRRWQGEACPRQVLLDAYERLRRRNAACFAASALWADYAIASASPERLFRLQDGVIETRPIAGTRATAHDAQANASLMQELRSHPKEQAEHIMLVDLERHDLGVISQAGSVQVDELLELESYASVHHLVSNIRGELRAGLGLQDILAALFPGGTITGCPKIRCMQIIAELEGRPRGAYTGSLGYISDCGRMDFNILIRTLVWRQGRLQLDAGAGIVADSEPQAELRETQAKADGVLRALDVAGQHA